MPDSLEQIAATHELKTWPEYYERLVDGTKTFEYRRNDRGFKVGDILHLREYDSITGHYSGREMRRRVTYLLATDISGDFVVMALESAYASGRAEAEARIKQIEAERDNLREERKQYQLLNLVARRAEIAEAKLAAVERGRAEAEVRIKELEAERDLDIARIEKLAESYCCEAARIATDTKKLADAIETYAQCYRTIHDDLCPEDDTCECSVKWVNDGITSAVNYLRELSAVERGRADGEQAMRSAWDEATEDASAFANALTEAEARITVLERAVGNCFMMAKRQIAAHLNGNSTPAKDLERWQHVQRFCETTGSKSDILRGQLPTEITEGSEVAVERVRAEAEAHIKALQVHIEELGNSRDLAYQAAAQWRDQLAALKVERGRAEGRAALLREFVGFLSADVPELHNVEIPRLAASIDRYLALPAPEGRAAWQPIETAPHMRKLIVSYVNDLGKRRCVMACYYKARSLEMDDDYAEVGEYDEATGASFAPEGWYEEHEGDSPLMPLSGQPTHWMPLPASPATERERAEGRAAWPRETFANILRRSALNLTESQIHGVSTLVAEAVEKWTPIPASPATETKP